MAAPAKIFNNAKMTTGTTGTGTVTLGSASTGYFTFGEAGLANADVVPYRIDDGNDFEIGVGTYTSSGTTFSRDTVIGSKISGTAGTSKINLSGGATIAVVVTASQHQLPAFTQPTNLGITCSVGSNILTVAIKGADGNDPSEANPVLVPFRNATIATGTPSWSRITAALSMTTNATGATLGTSNGVPFRLWVLLFDNSGTPVLALWQSVTGGAAPTSIAALDESAVQSTTGISGSATSAGTFYTPNGTSLSSKAFRIIGYLDYTSGLTTAGSYASTPVKIQLFNEGVKKPGDILQTKFSNTSSQTTTTSSTLQATAASVSITFTAACNIALVNFSAGLETASIVGARMRAAACRGGSALTGIDGNVYNNAAAAQFRTGGVGLDAPQSASAQTYDVRVASPDNTTSVKCPGSANDYASIVVSEVMV